MAISRKPCFCPFDQNIEKQAHAQKASCCFGTVFHHTKFMTEAVNIGRFSAL
jgi:hypothetical protein